MVLAIRLLAWVARGAVAVGLRAESGVLRRDDHGEGVVHRQDHEGQQHRRHEHGVGGGVAFADFEKRHPQEPDPDGGYAEDAGAEEEEG